MADEAEIDAQLQKWRQGDVIIGVALPFIHAFDAHSPVTLESQNDVADDPPTERNPDFRSVAIEVEGFAVLTQTCDLVRKCGNRPYVELAPIVRVSDDVLKETVAGHRPVYAFLRPLADRNLLVDLDRVMTVEKTVLAKVPEACRISGCTTDEETREFARALSRKRDRFAFPTTFSDAMKSIRKRVKEKSGKDSDEGRFIDAIREVRVKAEPDWKEDDPRLTLYFIFPEDRDIKESFYDQAENMVQKFKPKDGQDHPDFVLVSITSMSALTYLSTDKLSWDDLSD